jgi:hypothetical protein
MAPRALPKIKLTYAQGFPRSGSLSFQELIQKDKLQKALLSSFCADMEWVESMMPQTKNVCYVLHRRGVFPQSVNRDSVFKISFFFLG